MEVEIVSTYFDSVFHAKKKKKFLRYRTSYQTREFSVIVEAILSGLSVEFDTELKSGTKEVQFLLPLSVLHAGIDSELWFSEVSLEVFLSLAELITELCSEL